MSNGIEVKCSNCYWCTNYGNGCDILEVSNADVFGSAFCVFKPSDEAYNERIRKLKEENKRLLNNLSDFATLNESLINENDFLKKGDFSVLKENLETLKEENEKLKGEVEKFNKLLEAVSSICGTESGDDKL